MATSPKQIADDALIDELRDIVGDENVLSETDELLVYECDGLPQHKHPPRAVVFPTSTEDVSEVLGALTRAQVSFAPRGAGTGLSGGALAVNRGVVIELARLREVLYIDTENRIATVQTGLVNARLSRAVAPFGLYYVPDPSSQPSCTIGGNIAENAGGIHCLKYGTTTDHVVGARVVLSDGSIVDLRSNAPGYDLLGVFVGSEGTFGIATEATVRLLPVPPAVRTLLADFLDVDNASRAVSAIIAAGILPAALEMMDNAIIRAVEASVFTAGLPTDAQAVLLVELDGVAAGIDEDAEKTEAILREHGARSVSRAADENERQKLWAARKGAFGAVGRLMPDVMIQDAVVPRSRLPEVLAETYRISARHNLQLANVFHAGDGNLHPLICFDLRRGADLDNVRQAGREIMETCVKAGGSITGEHGVGLDKSNYLPLIFSEDDMDAMMRVRAAFDPSGLCNPGKIIPMPAGCGEARAIATHSLSTPAATSPPSNRDAVVERAQLAGAKSPSSARLAGRVSEARVASEIKRITGSANVNRIVDTDLQDRFQFGAEPDRPLVVAPASSKELSEILQTAAREQLSVVPAGAATWLDTGNSITRADLIVTTQRMTKLVSHEPADLVATAEAGLSLTEFQKQLAQKGQWLPIDPPDDGRATLGGVVATALAGPQTARHGPLRSFVIGLRVALADGRLIKAGGNVVKNVAGYDLCKLFTGSFGTLGVITQITFKLRPLPAEARTIAASGSLEVLAAAGRRVSQQFFPSAVELVSRQLAADLAATGKPNLNALLVEFAGSSKSVIGQTAQALKFLREELKVDCVTVDDSAEIWRKLSAAPYQKAKNLIWLTRLRPTDLLQYIKELVAVEGDEAAHLELGWHAGLGDGRLRLIARAPIYHQEAVRLLARLRQKAESLGGSLVLENAPAEIRNDFDSWGSFGSAMELMKRVKQQLDPENLLSPGRMFA